MKQKYDLDEKEVNEKVCELDGIADKLYTNGIISECTLSDFNTSIETWIKEYLQENYQSFMKQYGDYEDNGYESEEDFALCDSGRWWINFFEESKSIEDKNKIALVYKRAISYITYCRDSSDAWGFCMESYVEELGSLEKRT